jgi:hypothetical protein
MSSGAGIADGPRADAAAWALIDALPAHPVNAPMAVAAAGRSKPSIYEALEQLQRAGVLLPLGKASRNSAWEVFGLVDLIAGLEEGESPGP